MQLQKMEPIVRKWYDAVAEGRWLGRRCTECGAIEFPPHIACNSCGHHETEWVELSGHGTLMTFVVPGIQNDRPHLKAHGGYGYGLVKLDEGPEYSFVVYCGKKRAVKAIQARLKDGEVIGVHARPIERETPIKAGEEPTVTWSELCFELDELGA